MFDQSVGAIMGNQPLRDIMGLADVKPPFWILENAKPRHENWPHPEVPEKRKKLAPEVGLGLNYPVSQENNKKPPKIE